MLVARAAAAAPPAPFPAPASPVLAPHGRVEPAIPQVPPALLPEVPPPERFTIPGYDSLARIPVWDTARAEPSLWPHNIQRTDRPNRVRRWVVFRGSPPGIFYDW